MKSLGYSVPLKTGIYVLKWIFIETRFSHLFTPAIPIFKQEVGTS